MYKAFADYHDYQTKTYNKGYYLQGAVNNTLQEAQHHLFLNTCISDVYSYMCSCGSDVYSYISGAEGVEISRDAMTCPYQYPATNKLSLAIIIIKQMYVYI